MNRRDFVRLGLLVGAAYLGRAQVAVPGLWRPPPTYNVNDMFWPLDELIQLRFDAHPARDDAFLGYDRTKLYG